MSLSRRKKRLRVRGPRRKRMTRQARLASAAAAGWVGRYGGRDLVRGYARWFGVDRLCAVLELRRLGVAISADEEERARQHIATAARLRAERRASGRILEPVELEDGCSHLGAAAADFIATWSPDGGPCEDLDDQFPW